MCRSTAALTLTLMVVSTVTCGGQPAGLLASPAPVMSATSPALEAPAEDAKPMAPTQPLPTIGAIGQRRGADGSPPRCQPADWSARKLAPPLKPGKTATPSRPDRRASDQLLFASECTDAPGGPTRAPPPAIAVDGVEVRLVSATPAGSSGRGWPGSQCTFELSLADGSGATTRLGTQEVPPFTTVSALVRFGSAAWLSVSFNGYSAEFPKGGNRIVAVDLCDGRVVWQSKDSMSNGGLLLLDDYLVAPYGFTNERRYLFVLDSHSGNVIQKLPVIENICPSKNWAPNWRPGQRCDAPGQAVGAATAPRIEGGLLLVDTNTGSSTFQLN